MPSQNSPALRVASEFKRPQFCYCVKKGQAKRYFPRDGLALQGGFVSSVGVFLPSTPPPPRPAGHSSINLSKLLLHVFR